MPISEVIRRRKVVEYQLPPHLQVGGGTLLGGSSSDWRFRCTAGESLQEGDPVRIGSDGKAYKTLDVVAQGEAVGFAANDAASGGTVVVITSGQAVTVAFSGLQVGKRVWLRQGELSTTPEPAAIIKPFATQPVGWAVGSNKVLVHIERAVWYA